MKRAIIVGCDGQDGRLLADRLARQGCQVLGIGRAGARASQGAAPAARVDITDAAQVLAAVADWAPQAIFYLAAYHHSAEQRDADELALLERSIAVNLRGLGYFLEGVRRHAPAARVFYAASSHIYGAGGNGPQDEGTPLQPRCPYGLTKAAGLQLCRVYRARHGVYAAAGILYNHESPLRKLSFVSQKIVHGAWQIRRGLADTLVLGDLSATIDWGYAPDYVDAMLRIVALPEAEDFVVATGETHTVREFVELAFARLGLSWQTHVRTDPSLLRKPLGTLVGNPEKLYRQTGWRPTVRFADMVALLVDGAGGEAYAA